MILKLPQPEKKAGSVEFEPATRLGAIIHRDYSIAGKGLTNICRTLLTRLQANAMMTKREQFKVSVIKSGVMLHVWY